MTMGQAAVMDVTRMATLVVAEEGAPYAVPFGNLWGLALLQQDHDEASPALASRVSRVVDRVHRDGQRVYSAWLLFNSRRDPASFAARARIARTVAAAIAGAGGGTLVIVVEAGEARDGLFSLVGGLLEADTPSSVTVRVCFNPATPVPVAMAS
jgi:hypothetical protein